MKFNSYEENKTPMSLVLVNGVTDGNELEIRKWDFDK